VKASFDIPELMKTIVKCKAPLVLNVLKGLTSENVIKSLNAGDMNTAIKELKIRNVNTENNIIYIIMKNLKDELRNKQLILKCTQDMWFDSAETQTERIHILKEQIHNIEEKIETLLQRLVDNSMCSICYLEIDDGKIITPCCKNSFCLACLVKWTQYKNSCPTCRHNPFNIVEMYVIRPNINLVHNDVKTEELLDKFVEFEKMIVKMNTKECKVLIFSEYNDTLEKIEKILCKNKINSLTLQDKGINSKIDKYKTDKEFNILLINSRYFGCGINLELTTDIILFHKFDTSLEKQVLGRAQRPGRKSPLNVWYLLNENELNINE
jgi:SNF2 family DNA or RNA helicase